MRRQEETLQALYERLLANFGPQHWWPGESAFEVVIGAILTQNTNWKNVEKALANLKEAGLFDLSALSGLAAPDLAELIRPAGYYNIKAGRLHNLFTHVNGHYEGSLDMFFALPTRELREELLSIKGVGPETADAILLYAAKKPIFVVDAYTYRILLRHNLISEDCDYHQMQALFMDSFAEDIDFYGEYHALLVRTGKKKKKKSNPLCETCPLNGL